jgi:hypothetical protein
VREALWAFDDSAPPDPTRLDAHLERARAAWLREMAPFANRFGGIQLPVIPLLTERHVQNCRLLASRDLILERVPKGGVAAEVGVQTGSFSRLILDIARPSQLHLIDLDLRRFRIAETFEAEVEAGVVRLHEGDSSARLRQFPDACFDFVYVDADHTYAGVKRDIEAVKPKLKERAFLIFNDYTYWSPTECMPYGVVQAVNELCLEEDWELVYLALAHYMYCDVAIRRR